MDGEEVKGHSALREQCTQAIAVQHTMKGLQS